MPAIETVPYGSWTSPISADTVVAGDVRLGRPQIAGTDVYWLEQRPSEGGRTVVVRRAADGATADVTPPGYNVRSRVHEYGGGAYLATEGAVYFVNYADQAIHCQAGGEVRRLTPSGAMRYADLIPDLRRRRLLCVREDHSQPDREPSNTLVAVSLDREDAGVVLASGYDFYASPRLSPDGGRLAWLSWRHPNMPWDGCELWLAEIGANGSLVEPRQVAGGPEESIFQPAWSPDGLLYFVSDRTGWWNLYVYTPGQTRPLCPLAAEFGLPQWQFGMATYVPLAGGRLLCTYVQAGTWHMALLDASNGRLDAVALPYTGIRDPVAVGERAIFTCSSPTDATAIVELDLGSRARTVLCRASAVTLSAGYLSLPRPVTFPTSGGRKAYGFFYPPQNATSKAPAGERPPLLVMIHGGPTGASDTGLNLEIQYWTSRGIAVLDVDYSGSTGYGRAYRERLNGQWGIADVEDCVNGARYLAEAGLVDGKRLAITGGSAGGYTVLCALTFHDAFATGASYYGVSDLEALARDTHKFEARYLDRLVGPYPDQAEIYYQRSPIHFVDQLARPLILFQGLEDPVVPPEQAQLMYEAVRAKGLPVAYLPFPGEQHGFRRAENIKRALEAELYFYSRIFNFELADSVEPIPIANL